MHYFLIYEVYLIYKDVTVCASEVMKLYKNMPCTYIRHSFVWFYIFTLHIIQLLIVKVVVTQPRVSYVSQMLPSIHQVTIKTIHCA